MPVKPWIAVIIIVAVIFVLILILHFLRARKVRTAPMDEMEGREFEAYCADLLKDHGFSEVEMTRGSGDFGVDVLAQRDGVTYAIQCKRYDGPVGIKAVQEVYAGRDYYDRMVGAVMTNQYFTDPAVDAAKKLNILLWDRDYIETMEEE